MPPACASPTICASWWALGSVVVLCQGEVATHLQHIRVETTWTHATTVAARLSCSIAGYALSLAGKCLPCSTSCNGCKIVPPNQARCTACYTLSLVNGECRRCDDPRCADCSGNEHRCKRCRNEKHVVNKATGRCEDPSWPVPCRTAPGPGRRGGCTSTVHTPVRKPKASAVGRSARERETLQLYSIPSGQRAGDGIAASPLTTFHPPPCIFPVAGACRPLLSSQLLPEATTPQGDGETGSSLPGCSALRCTYMRCHSEPQPCHAGTRTLPRNAEATENKRNTTAVSLILTQVANTSPPSVRLTC